jgi:hypothetical protein
MILLGRLLLALGFLAGAFVTVREEARVNWGAYLPCTAALLGGVILVRRASSSQQTREKARENVAALERSAETLCTKIAGLKTALEERDVFAIHGLIDEQLVDDLAIFADNREGLIRRYDLMTYADIMSAFALSERLVNRCWSASADGYVDEVRRCLQLAEDEMVRAREKLAAAAARG